ncbi:MAG: adenylate/guanylate cyclase domain-containing protein [Alphaproteobacteria bacterium]|nr:MAG: adenylate/guanylate cyclase domain-containing protein [Alphaproteobacteria bacterium]
MRVFASVCSVSSLDRSTPDLAAAHEHARPIVTWLLEEERLRAARTARLLDHMVQKLRAAGIPLDRVSLHIQQLHPQLAARSFAWDYETGHSVEVGYQHSVRNTDSYLASPVRIIYEGGRALRRRLEDPTCARDYPVLEELGARGFTDYVIAALPFSGEVTNAISIATCRPGGFSDLDLAILDEVHGAFAAVLELQQVRRTARDLLSTYVGRDTGERIFNGLIRRGEGERIHAVLWYCDLRGFTELSQNEPLEDIITLLNDYFDAAAQAVERHEGEILKFIGDAILAIFPCRADDVRQCRITDAAVAAAENAVANVASLSQQRTHDGRPPVRCAVAIHIGEVMYGNVGSADRLDFTVIGPAVNMVTRMEKVCAMLDLPIVVSGDVARIASRPFRAIGRHALKGIAQPQELFVPDRSQSGGSGTPDNGSAGR